MRSIDARHFETGHPVRLEFSKGILSGISELNHDGPLEELPFVCPGLFDIQINGYAGIWFSSPDLSVDQVETVTQHLVDHGIARYFPTLVTNSFAALSHGFDTIRRACDKSDLVRASVRGCHLEGPYISAEDGPRGAHPLQHVRPADFKEFQRLQEVSGNRIRLVTLAPECENGISFIRQCRNAGVVVAIGHSAASPEVIGAAAEAGAELSTHLGNGAHATLPRHPNYIWEQLAEDRLWASVIADGWHLPDSVLKCILACKTLPRTILTCDVSGFGGCPPGEYSEGSVRVEVMPDGRIVVAGQRQYLAGSGATMGPCVAHAMNACGLSLSQAVSMATVNPARLFGETTPVLEVGSEATLTVFSMPPANNGTGVQFVPVETIICGNTVSRNS